MAQGGSFDGTEKEMKLFSLPHEKGRLHAWVIEIETKRIERDTFGSTLCTFAPQIRQKEKEKKKNFPQTFMPCGRTTWNQCYETARRNTIDNFRIIYYYIYESITYFLLCSWCFCSSENWGHWMKSFFFVATKNWIFFSFVRAIVNTYPLHPEAIYL